MKGPIVLAYSGGLDTSVILHYLKEKYKGDVIAFYADIGQEEDLKEIEEKAFQSGAKDLVILDVKEEFINDYVFPMLRAGAVYEGEYLLGTSIARPLIGKKQVEIARKFRAVAVAHGATGKGNDQVRFELTYMTLAPDLQIIAPWREWEFRSRTELIEYAQKHRIPVKATPSKPYSTDANLWHISYEGGVLEDPSFPPPEEIFQRTVSPEKAPEEGVEITISWEEGKPVAINGDPLSPATLVQKLNAIAGAHGVGRVDIVEDRFVGIKSRGVYETPAGTVLLFTLRALESLVLEREVRHRRLELMPRYAQLIYNGQWFSPERLALQAFFDSVSSFLTGEVKVKLYKGNIILKSRSSPYSLYQKELSTFEEGKGFSQKDATGFIRLVGAPLSLWGKIQMGKKKE